MTATAHRLSREELARLGDSIFEGRVRPAAGAADRGHYVVIDVSTGDFEINADESAASDRLLARHPEAQIWLRQIGSRYARRFGKRPGADFL